MSLLSQYKKERENKETLEVDGGFAVYQYGDDFVYIEDIYVIPDKRKDHLATSMSKAICDQAKNLGKKYLIGSVCVGANNDTDSLKVLLAHGMKLKSVYGNLIYFQKEL